MQGEQPLVDEAEAKLRQLRPEQIAEVIDFIDFLRHRGLRELSARSAEQDSIAALRAWLGQVPGLCEGTDPQQWVDALRQER